MPASFVPRSFRLRVALLTLAGLLLVVGSPAARPVLSAGAAHHARLNGPPARGSGALSAYPLNHTLDTAVSAVGTPPTNSDFEAPGQNVGTPPTNDDFSSAPTTAGAPPQNSDFETGDLSGWTTTWNQVLPGLCGADRLCAGAGTTVHHSRHERDHLRRRDLRPHHRVGH